MCVCVCLCEYVCVSYTITHLAYLFVLYYTHVCLYVWGADYENSPSEYISLGQPQSDAPGTEEAATATHSHAGDDVRSRGGLLISAAQVRAIKEYHPDKTHCANILGRFSSTKAYFQNKSYSESSFKEANESSSGYLDMGTLVVGSKVVLRLKVSNETAHSVKVDITTHGLSKEVSPSVTSLPQLVAAGLGLIAYVAFTVDDPSTSSSSESSNSRGEGGGRGTTIRAENVLGYVTVKAYWPAEPSVASTSVYPVFFRTIPPTTIANQMKLAHLVSDSLAEYPLCCPSSIAHLLKGVAEAPTTPLVSTTGRRGSVRWGISSNTFIDHFPHTTAAGCEAAAGATQSTAPTPFCGPCFCFCGLCFCFCSAAPQHGYTTSLGAHLVQIVLSGGGRHHRQAAILRELPRHHEAQALY
jgi:hypothetical protein